MGELVTTREIRTMSEAALPEQIRIRWHQSDPQEVAHAEKIFDEYLGKGWMAFAESQTRRQQIFTFDPSLNRIILSPPIGGG